MASRVAGKIKLQSVDELLGVPEIAGTQEIEIERIHAFPNHPFKVLDDEKMDTLVDSIRENGILNPVSMAVAIIGAGWKAYDTEIQRNTVMVICFAVTVILGLISWKGIKAKES